MLSFRQGSLLGEYVKEPAGVIAGIDEVGRGCLAGPVVTAAVVLPPKYILPYLKDSKQLTPKRREALAKSIREVALAWSIGLIGQGTIDKINILQATFMAMAMAAARLPLTPNFLYIDGNKTIPTGILQRFWRKHKTEVLPRQQAVVKGDVQIPVISAASILAKTYRDSIMRFLAKRWPVYGFEDHVGYGSKYHLQKLKEYGPCPLHRLTFRGVVNKPKIKEVQGSLLAFL
ncbi:MAG: ribonuclease HII [Desulfovibrionaceae bacterium]|nr:ribonuclease HII [Desulfovibrionaceae bacterium]